MSDNHVLDNQVWLSADSTSHFLDPPINEFYSTSDCLDLYLLPGKDSFVIAVVSPWTTYYCSSFSEVRKCITSIADTYCGGINNGCCRFSEKG